MRWKELGRGADRRARSEPKPNRGTTKIREWRNKEGESAGRVEKEAENRVEKSRRSSRGKEVKKKGDDRSADRK